ncbi:PAS domain-containing sensor histidine kinase [Cystobacter fuscus]|uniref:histidine kinase n=1 Tax=Cystobacter fuscus TaxID=43 RepID=A0A250J9J4_9BACT|nr:ATP-binding protein [Cystobacter fuscus]ATB40243.1 PAS domain-containing sensor histidine kinase [Cystobacter fuscus]
MKLPRGKVAEAVGFTLLYMAIARLSVLTLVEDGITVMWPVAGLSLGVLLLRGRWLWIFIVLGALGANLLAGLDPPLALCLALAHGLEMYLAAVLLSTGVDFSPSLHRFKDILFLGMVSLGTTAVGATLAALSFWWVGPPGVSPWWVARTWWLADQLSVWILTPVVLILSRTGLPRKTTGEWLLLLVFLALLGVMGWRVFLTPFEGHWLDLPYLTFPMLLWIALRFGPFGTVLGNLLVGTVAIVGTLSGRGVFMIMSEPNLSLQLYLGTAPLTSLLLAVITEDRRRNAELARSNQQWLQATLRAARAATWEWDAIGDHMTRSVNHDLLFGLPETRSDWNREDFLCRIHPEDRPRVSEELERALRGDGSYEAEFRVPQPDGSVRWLAFRATPRRQKERCVGLSGVVLDITQRKQQEQVLSESEHRFQRLADTAPVLLWMWAQDTGCTYLNRPWLDFTRRPLAEQLGEGWLEDVHPEDRLRRLAALQEATRARQPFEVEYRLRHHTGDYHWMLEQAVPRFAGESFLGFIGACADVQRLKEAEGLVQERSNRLAELNAELARSNADLEQFAYVTSHDLREPIRMVASYGELLERRYGDRLDERGHKYLGYIIEGALRLRDLVDDLLAYSRAGRGDQQPVESSVEQVLQRVQVTLHQAIEESEAQLLHGALPTVESLPSQLEVLLQNLIENAIKFRSAAPPRITVLARECPDGWEFEVQDNGIGIEPQYLERIFGLFQRLHSREQYPGTGMGLAICKRIVERHGGRIWATSVPGQGTSIHFTLRQKPRPAGGPRALA